MRKNLTTILLIALLVIGMVSGTVLADASDVYKGDHGDETYYYIAISTSIPWFIPSKNGFLDACEALGVEGKFVGPNDHNISAQVRTMEEVIAQDPAGIILHAGDPDALTPPSRQAMDAEIPVITFGNDIADTEARYGFIGAKMVNYGKALGERVAEVIDGKGKVAVFTMVGQLAHEQRVDGIKQKLAEYPDIEIVTVEDSTLDTSMAINKAHDIMRKHPDLDAFVATVSIGSTGAAMAMREEGKAGDVKVVAAGKDQAILQDVESGVAAGSITQNTYISTWIATHYLYWANNNSYQDQENWRDAGTPPMPPNTLTGTTTITKENVEYFKK